VLNSQGEYFSLFDLVLPGLTIPRFVWLTCLPTIVTSKGIVIRIQLVSLSVGIVGQISNRFYMYVLKLQKMQYHSLTAAVLMFTRYLLLILFTVH